MGNNLFSTYKTGENRVTASILAVLRSLSLGRIERLLGALMEQSTFELVRFQNQPSRGAAGVPDAEIVSSCRLLVETKIERDAVRADQLTRHLQRLDHSKEAMQGLLVITPDATRPAVISENFDPRLFWAPFAALDQAIDELLGDKTEVVAEREAFLLRELQTMLWDEKLVGALRDTVVVAARNAWPEYQRYHAYICQPGRTFQPVQYLAFYAESQIYPVVARILEVNDNIRFEHGRYTGRIGQLIEQILRREQREEGTVCKIFLLSPPDDADTIHLDGPILNNLCSASGRPSAFTQGQRYVRLADLMKAKNTAELISN
ncbi:MAG: hypothetical protein AB7G75_04570 [Candidatus Binatia bacterium]